MPKVRQLTEELRNKQEEEEQARRTRTIIIGAARCNGMSMTDLSKSTGIQYDKLLRHLSEGKLTVKELTLIGKRLCFDLGTYAACCGAKERCRFENGGSV